MAAPSQAERRLEQQVIASFARCPDPRLRRVLQSLVKHLHAFVREVELTEEEWMTGIRFLTEVGKTCDDVRQEFILLSDTLGVSMLVDAINHRKPKDATEATVLGPFYRQGAPEIANGGSIVRAPGGSPCSVRGRILDQGGAPIAGAMLDVWQTAANGMYEGQDPDQPAFNLRGRLRSDAQGRFAFETVLPVSYPIPHDGPVGRMLKATRRHPYRPAHLHLVISAPGFETVTTHIFVKGDKYLASDAVFAVKELLVEPFRRRNGRYEVRRDFVLVGKRAAPSPRGTGLGAGASATPSEPRDTLASIPSRKGRGRRVAARTTLVD